MHRGPRHYPRKKASIRGHTQKAKQDQGSHEFHVHVLRHALGLLPSTGPKLEKLPAKFDSTEHLYSALSDLLLAESRFLASDTLTHSSIRCAKPFKLIHLGDEDDGNGKKEKGNLQGCTTVTLHYRVHRFSSLDVKQRKSLNGPTLVIVPNAARVVGREILTLGNSNDTLALINRRNEDEVRCLFLRSKGRGMGSIGAAPLRIEPLCSLLALHRMHATCVRRPKVTFMNQLLGHVPTHVVFESEDEVEQVENKAAKTEEVEASQTMMTVQQSSATPSDNVEQTMELDQPLCLTTNGSVGAAVSDAATEAHPIVSATEAPKTPATMPVAASATGTWFVSQGKNPRRVKRMIVLDDSDEEDRLDESRNDGEPGHEEEQEIISISGSGSSVASSTSDSSDSSSSSSSPGSSSSESECSDSSSSSSDSSSSGSCTSDSEASSRPDRKRKYERQTAKPRRVVQVNSILEEEDVAAQLGELNPSQRNAVSGFLDTFLSRHGCTSKVKENSLQLLQGPPGSGKTVTVVALLKSLWMVQNDSRYVKLQRHQSRHLSSRVMVCAPSNKAVQVVLEKFLKADYGEILPPTVSLVGVSESVPEHLNRVFLHNIHQVIIDQASRIKECVDADKMNSKKLKRRFGLLSDTISSRVPNTVKDSSTEVGKSFMAMRNSLNCVFTMKSAQRNSSGVVVATRQSVDKFIKSFKTELSSSGKFQRQLEAEYLQRSNFVFCTLATSGRSLFSPKSGGGFDALIVDEAAQAMEAETLVPLWCSPRQCLLVGDPQQLAAMVNSPVAASQGLGRSLMQRLMQDAGLAYQMLDTQYRMHPHISRFPSAQYYGQQLQDAASVLPSARPVPLGIGTRPWLNPYQFIDVAGEEGREGKHGGSYLNAAEAQVVATVLGAIAESGVRPETKVVVITFYNAQVRAIRSTISQMQTRDQGLWNPRQVPVHTVDSYQGSEADVVIVSFVRANAQHRVGFLKDYRRLNVALTRAKHSLLAIGNHVTLAKCDNADLNALAADASQRGLVMSADEVC